MTQPVSNKTAKSPGSARKDLIILSLRKKAESALKESEARFRAFFEQGMDGILILDPATGRFLEFNDQVCRQLGYSREEFARLHVHDIEAVETAEEVIAHIAKVRREGFDRFETRHRTRDGEIRCVHVTAQSLTVSGNPIYLCVWRDITERKQFEEKMLEQERKYRVLFEAANDGILLFDGAVIVDCNRRGADMFGLARQELIGRHNVDLSPRIQPDGRLTTVVAAEKRVAALDGESQRFQWRYLRSDGVVFDAEVALSRVEIGGTFLLQAIIRDITERKRTEDALREAERKLRTLVDNIPLGIARFDAESRFIFANPAISRALDTSSENLIGKTMREVGRPESDASSRELERMIKQAFEQGVANAVELECLSAEGFRTLDFLQIPERDESGKTVSVLHICHDITERKRAEEQLKASEAMLRSVFQATPLGLTLNIDRTIVSVNDSMCKIMGYGEEELVGKDVRQFYETDEEYERVGRELYAAVSRSGRSSVETRFRRKDGTVIHASLSAAMLRADDPSSGHIVTVQDITERKRAEEQLRAGESMLRSVFQAAPVGVTFIQDRVIRSVNDSMSVLLGCGEEEMVGKTTRQFYETEQEYERIGRELYSQVYLKGQAALETRLRRKDDGSVVHVSLTAAMLRPDDPSAGYVVTLQDIAERKRAEEERRILEDRLQRAEKMEALGTLAGGVAHDLNNVLGIVVGYSEMLLYGLEESSPDRYKAEEILKGGQRAAAIIQDLLTLARRGVPSRRILNLNKILMECRGAPEFEKLCSFHPKVRIKIDFEPDLLNMAGSPVHLEKTFMNLISNAAEAMADGGVITIKTRNQYLDKAVSGYDEVKEGDYVVLSVSDDGEGIRQSDLQHIFEPFYTRKVMGRSGTGLGLAVVWGTVKDHFGYINVESEVGKGTTFTLYFPVTREDITPERISTSLSEYMGKGESILVIDDVREQRELATMMLTKLNYRVVSASSGEEALEYLRQQRVDLVILDMIMDPGMDGLDTYTKILEIHLRQKAIIVSGFSETERVSKAKSLGVGAYVKKPYVLEKLGLAVREELDRPEHVDSDGSPRIFGPDEP